MYKMEKLGIYCIVFILCVVSKTEAEQIQTNSNVGGNEPASVQDQDYIPFPSFLQVGAVDSNFPNYTTIPSGLRFSCYNREPGYYANPLTDCQVYHHCLPDGRSFTFMCGVGTIFNQRSFICDHWYNYDCSAAEDDYKYNAALYNELKQPENGLENSSDSSTSSF